MKALTPKDEFFLLILQHLQSLGIDEAILVPEYKFHKTRDWRFDGAIPELRLAFEYEGLGKGHLTRKHYSKDCEKYTWADALGWTLVRITELLISDGRAGPLIRNAINFTINPSLVEPYRRPDPRFGATLDPGDDKKVLDVG
jgi:hypothetical protein